MVFKETLHMQLVITMVIMPIALDFSAFFHKVHTEISSSLRSTVAYIKVGGSALANPLRASLLHCAFFSEISGKALPSTKLESARRQVTSYPPISNVHVNISVF